MTITAEWKTGTETVTTTEWSMTTDASGVAVETTTGIFVPRIEFDALAAAGDIYEWRCYEKARTGDTQRLIGYARIGFKTPLWIGPALMLGVGWDMTLDKLAGTDRAINWSISRTDPGSAFTLEDFTFTESVGSTNEWSITTDTIGPDADTTAGVFQPFIDLSALAAGDVFDFRVYEKARTGDSQKNVFFSRIANAQACPVWTCPAMVLNAGWDMTLKKVSGTDRTLFGRISSVT